jgi:type IV secretory pathway TraG/TraD family ATPase VirD4
VERVVSRALGPRPPLAAGNAALAWTLIGVAWGIIGLAWLVWASARVAASLHGAHIPAFSARWVLAVVHGRTRQAWPGTPTLLVAVIAGVAAAVLAVAITGVWRVISRRITKPGDPVAALSQDRSIRQLAPVPAAAQSIRLRPSLAGARPASLAPADIGLLLGRLKQPGGNGPDLLSSWEETVLAFMGPRSGKTTSLGVPYVLSAPGPVVATTTRADLWAATAELRAASGSAIWVFDPQHITAAGQHWWWNPLAGLTSVEAAHRLASHFVLTVNDSTRRDIWGPAAQELLTSLLLAAAASGRTLRHVSRWLDDPGSPTPAQLLDDAGYRALGSALRGAQHGAPETRDGIYQTARTAATCLHDDEIMAWVTPPGSRRLVEFDPAWFALTRDVLYLLTESRAAASPLIAGLTDAAMRAGRRRAEQAGGRLDPPMVLVLDECANICRIADLPDLYSHLGGRGMVPVTILQSYEQGVTVWGEPGMAALWGSATKKLIGAGVDSPRLARDIAVLVGHHDVPVRSISTGDGRASEQISYQRRLILEAADIRAIERGSALLLSSGARPALIDLRPWHARPDAALIDAARLRAEAAIQQAARAASSGPENAGGPPLQAGNRPRDAT